MLGERDITSIQLYGAPGFILHQGFNEGIL